VATYGAAALVALGDPTRQAIVELLAGGPRAVGEIARELPVTRPAVSQHLRVLKEASLVTDRQDGTRRLYELNQAGADAVRDYLDRLWNQALAAFKRAAEQDESNRDEGETR
jgi:DNA-binding transcriptional ArsR family regulator